MHPRHWAQIAPFALNPSTSRFNPAEEEEEEQEALAFLNHEVAAQLFLASDERHLYAFTSDGWRAFSKGVWHEHGASDLIQRAVFEIVSSKLTHNPHHRESSVMYSF